MSRKFNPGLDEAIRATYVEWHVPLDDLLVDPPRAIEFADTVRTASPALKTIDTPTILRRAMTLRKLGKDRGGLDRLER